MRRGHTLLELLVALVISAFVLTAAVAVASAQGRVQRRLRASIAGAGVRRDGSDVVPLLLTGLSSGMLDVPAGGARDSTLDFRELVSAGVACAASDGTLRFADPEADAAVALPQPSDSLWLLVAPDSARAWVGAPITAVRGAASGCAPGDSAPAPAFPPVPASALSATVPVMHGAVVAARVTRRARLSVYRASDGDWYLGLREWSAALGALETVQPVVGPLARPSGSSRAFVYRDAAGVSLGGAAATTPARIATIEVTVAAARDPADSAIARAAPSADRAVVGIHP